MSRSPRPLCIRRNRSRISVDVRMAFENPNYTKIHVLHQAPHNFACYPAFLRPMAMDGLGSGRVRRFFAFWARSMFAHIVTERMNAA